MKLINLLFIITLTATLFSCDKEKNQSATIIRDCTGTYLRIDSKDYLVCNIEKTNEFEENDSVVVTYRAINDCSSNGAVCLLYHKNEGPVKVYKIRKK